MKIKAVTKIPNDMITPGGIITYLRSNRKEHFSETVDGTLYRDWLQELGERVQ